MTQHVDPNPTVVGRNYHVSRFTVSLVDTLPLSSRHGQAAVQVAPIHGGSD